jgi:hypothetical protein
LIAPRLVAAAAIVCACAWLGPFREASAQRDVAAFDMTGYWVAVVTEDWKFRMVMPAQGVYGGIPLTAAARQLADRWQPTPTDVLDCRAVGAASLMRVPGRLRIGWRDETTLSIAADTGNQTRLLHFDSTQAPPRTTSRQGYSVAAWRYAPGQGPRDGAALAGDLKVVTTALDAGFLRPNGVPHGTDATVTEYFNIHRAPNGDDWLVVTIVVEDPQYLSRPFLTSANFKRISSDAGWHPTPCS